MNKNDEKERKSSKGQCKDGKRSKINKSRGNDNKLPPANDKGGKSDSNKFPNFNRLTTEEKLVFFKALSTAKKNVQDRGVPTRERFGTVHDEYLQYFPKEGECEDEVATENLGVSTISPPPTCPCLSDTLEESSPRSPEPSLPDPCEEIIRKDTDSIIDLYLEKKKRNAYKCSAELKKKEEEPEEKMKAQKSAWPSLTTPKTTNTPQFNALNAEEKTIFFKILEKARNKVVEKNPEKKKGILPLESIVRMYQDHSMAPKICIPEEKKSRNLRVKLTLTSGDNERIQMTQKQKQPDLVLPPEEEIEEEVEAIPQSVMSDIKEEPRGKTSMDSFEECSVSNQSIHTKISTAENKPEKTTLEKETWTVSETEIKQKTKEEEGISQLNNTCKSSSQINPEEASNEAVEREGSGLLLKQHGAMDIPSLTEEEEKKSETSNYEKNPSDIEHRKVFGLSLQELTSEKDLASAQKEGEEIIQECKVRGDEEDQMPLQEEECAKKKLETPEGKEISGEVCENKEEHERKSTEQKEEATVKCESKSEVETEEINKKVETVCESLVDSLRMEVSQEKTIESEPTEKKMEVSQEETIECEPKEKEMEVSQEETIESEAKEKKMEESLPGPALWDQTTTSAKVMIVEDNVIEKIRNLIYYLEQKARKDESSEKEYLKLLVDYVEYLSKILHTLVLKKENQIQNTYITAGAHLTFDDSERGAKGGRRPEKPTAADLGPRSVSAQALGADALLASSQQNVTDSKKPPDALFATDSDISLGEEEDDEVAYFLPPTIGNKKVMSTKIRLLQDLLKQRAEFVEGVTEDFKIVQHPEEEIVPVQKSTTVKLLKEEGEENDQQDHNFFKALIRCLTCGKKKEEDGIYENLKGEAVRVDVAEERDDSANATLNPTTKEVLKAAERKKIIEKYYNNSDTHLESHQRDVRGQEEHPL